ncbi:MAG: DUF4091 domain-containing protein [Verrucomicrobia bacterium]|nr:DUF4091 domain-containing protein [Verrucomicrobiota bacterium]
MRLSSLMAGAVIWPLIGLNQTVPAILDDSFGYRLASPPEVAVWWCEATYKVGRHRALPSATGAAVEIEAARSEYEPFQIVLLPEATLTNLTVSVADFVRQGNGPGATIAATNVEVCLVEYVPVTEPSDSFGVVGEWPDPLVPLTEPVTTLAGTNQPFWFTVYVPKEAPAGDYEAAVTFSADGLPPFDVTVRLHVFNFALSDVTHTRTAYGLTLDYNWHGLTTDEEKNHVWDLYLQNFRKHRISPYMPHYRAQIWWGFASDTETFRHNFIAFDAAMERYLDEFNFNSFKFMDEPWTLNGHPRFSAGFNQLFAKLLQPMMAHFRERGWAEKAYAYWIDEPDAHLFPFVIEGMQAHLEAAPGLRRLLTLINTLRPELFNHVDTWAPIMAPSMYRPDEIEDRLRHGDEVWWYTASFPVAPQASNFIDHPALSHRIRGWMAEKHGVGGELYWQTAWYTGTNGPRNPWEDAMSAAPTGSKLRNGDGMLLYPPVKNLPNEPVLAGPINSLRWELLREALEDREYFWLLKATLDRAISRLGPDHPAVLEGYAAREAALALVPSISIYERDPQVVYAARQRLALAIESLEDGLPFFAREPVSRAAAASESVVLRTEGLGWPLPALQWRLNGMNIPGVTGPTLTLTNLGTADVGDYTVVASNSVGVATSAVARLAGYWQTTPQIVSSPASLTRYAGGNAVFSVTSVSTNALTYQWMFNDNPLEHPYATQPALLLTNLDAGQAGQYAAVVSNAMGVVTSSVATLTVLVNPSEVSVVSGGSQWRYHDLGLDLGTAWRQPGYDDSAWASGLSPLGFGNGDEATALADGMEEKPNTIYFRKAFETPAALSGRQLAARLRSDDGAVVYVNGAEVFRQNLPTGDIGFHTSALTPVEGADEAAWITFHVPSQTLHPGANVIAVEVHQYADNVRPVAFWMFDEAESPWQDLVGGHDFEAVGTNVVAKPGRVEGCVTNSGAATSWLETPDRSELRYSGPFTAGGWFAFGMGGGNDPATTCLEKADEFRLYYTGTAVNRYRFRVGDVEVQDQTSGTISGQWRFVVAWYDGTNAFLQVDNGSVHSVAASAPMPTSNPLVALKRAGEGGGFAADEVFLYRRVLSESERTIIRTSDLRTVLATNVEDLAFDFELTAMVVQLPVFVDSPASLVRHEGETAAFQLTAVSSTPVSYQWLFEGAPISGATNTFLFMSELTHAQSGLYSLVASNLGGAVTSAPAMLTVVGQPELQVQWLGEGTGLKLVIPASPASWSLLVSTNFTDWSVLATVPPASEPNVVMDSSASNAPFRFYRLRRD